MKDIYFRLVLTVILFSTIVFMVGCNDTTFSGSKTNNNEQYLVDFDVLNITLKGSIPLLKGEIV